MLVSGYADSDVEQHIHIHAAVRSGITMTGSKGSNNGKARRSDQIEILLVLQFTRLERLVFNSQKVAQKHHHLPVRPCDTDFMLNALVKIVNRFSSPKFHMANTGVVWAGRPYGDAKTELDARRKFKSELEKFTSVHCIGVKMRGKWVYKELARESV
ncbi:uncharacterized protein PADG_06271 [Paracoccidioides brasiliensis Pb18]|uniref:Uncharacterized protein n=1 Tax=Paracoccidioides brasiliensis (strain Pb18) TaxID=502780 RepID=C1GG34_PARBD|nr:uncharacterized protein PADG_06271 [Paracoccidioides brasiliensis Pb18]EEH50192.2 hypothetical protein PADG_06271 [Paracoccidioides brasiliensis Pb18]